MVVSGDEFRNRGWQERIREMGSWRRGFIWMLSAALLAAALTSGIMFYLMAGMITQQVNENLAVNVPKSLPSPTTVVVMPAVTSARIFTVTPTATVFSSPTAALTREPSAIVSPTAVRQDATSTPIPTTRPPQPTPTRSTPRPTPHVARVYSERRADGSVWEVAEMSDRTYRQRRVQESAFVKPTPTTEVPQAPTPTPRSIRTYSERRADGSIWNVAQMSDGSYRQQRMTNAAPTPQGIMVKTACNGQIPWEEMRDKLLPIYNFRTDHPTPFPLAVQIFDLATCGPTVQTVAGVKGMAQIVQELNAARYGGPWDVNSVIAAYNRTVRIR